MKCSMKTNPTTASAGQDIQFSPNAISLPTPSASSNGRSLPTPFSQQHLLAEKSSKEALGSCSSLRLNCSTGLECISEVQGDTAANALADSEEVPQEEFESAGLHAESAQAMPPKGLASQVIGSFNKMFGLKRVQVSSSAKSLLRRSRSTITSDIAAAESPTSGQDIQARGMIRSHSFAAVHKLSHVTSGRLKSVAAGLLSADLPESMNDHHFPRSAHYASEHSRLGSFLDSPTHDPRPRSVGPLVGSLRGAHSITGGMLRGNTTSGHITSFNLDSMGSGGLGQNLSQMTPTDFLDVNSRPKLKAMLGSMMGTGKAGPGGLRGSVEIMNARASADSQFNAPAGELCAGCNNSTYGIPHCLL